MKWFCFGVLVVYSNSRTKKETNTRPSFLKRTRRGYRICLFQTAALTNSPPLRMWQLLGPNALNIHYIRNNGLFINLLVTFSCISHATLRQISAAKTVLMVAIVFIRPLTKQHFSNNGMLIYSTYKI